jgi:hypothetical protein
MPSTPAALDLPLTSAAQGFRVWGFGFGVRVLRGRVEGSAWKVKGLGLRVESAGFKVWDSGCGG